MAEAGSASRRWLFTLTILVGSFLLFMVQPMVARMALPRLGGAPNVWNSAMLVYQALLLAGYAYAHFIGRFTIRRQAIVHVTLLVLAGLTLPLALTTAGAASPGWEVVWVPWLFLLTVGPVFFAVSAQAPLMQSWYAAGDGAGDPYPLYAASNLGSFGGLLAYPLLVEPILPLGEQSQLWAVGYGALVLLVASVALARRKAVAVTHVAEEPRTAIKGSTIAFWLILSAVPSGLMLSTTTFLTTDIMAMPLLWVIPLGLYLLSFSIAFAENRTLARLFVLAAPVLVPLCAALSIGEKADLGVTAGIATIALLFIGAVALHSRLYSLRPPASELTRFYLFMSLGGVIGGAFTALFAPLLFDWTWEHPILILALVALLPLEGWKPLFERIQIRQAFIRTGLVVAVFGVMMVTGLTTQIALSTVGDRTRSYFGIYTVAEPEDGTRWLIHGTTTHGMQVDGSTQPTTYYGRNSGVGRVLTRAPELFGDDARIGVVGLGVGTLACYRQPGQQWTYFEIDPAVLDYSTRGQFTYLSECTPDARTIIGDARLELAALPDGAFDVLVIDAFSSDSIPLHLLTREAIAVYRRVMQPDGVLLIHISNRFIQLQPVIEALARDAGLSATIRNDMEDKSARTFTSGWIALSADASKFERITAQEGWEPLGEPADRLWTDDYASVLPHLKIKLVE
ncbi:fused MFS/spermidine synthase [Qipengyuania sp. GH38]|uniref:fused MFS/spermidine synthase n=1 Tax=Qipengyuania intermedia TaxID=2867244 RepID=UPI001C876327|nr:fused MFS/spermidine synthase [Qipengyuania intermedia]MBX7513920.1 fused MFS/spermidine synthase [Qipengyuania intermedia]